ncbi:MAG: hypothetical protein KBH29_08010 [Lutibacter sp.]|nr:hypothetical protein [Lutibacter sp.]
MFLCKSKKTITSVIVFLLTIGTYSQSYNAEIEAKLQIKEENGYISVKGTALNKTQTTKKLSYKLSVFKTGPNQNKSDNQQSGQFILNSNQLKDLSSTTINFNDETKVIILLLIYDSNLTIIGKDRVVFNDDQENNIVAKEGIANKIEDTAAELASEIINDDFEAKIQVENQNGIIIINSTAFNKTEITSSLIYKFTLFNSNESVDNIEEEKNSRFVVSANEKVNLSLITFKLNGTEKKIAELLIYNLDNEIVAQDRIVFNENSNDELEKKKVLDEKFKQEQENSQDVSVEVKDGLELRGIIVEDTKTKPGRDFYKLFYSLYTQNNINGNEVVKIKEILALGRNTKIEVIVGDDVVFSFFVRPSMEYLSKINDYAIIKVYRHFKNLENESKIIKRY